MFSSIAFGTTIRIILSTSSSVRSGTVSPGSQINWILTSLKYLFLYVQLSQIYFGAGRDYICKEAFNRQEAMKLIEADFEYVMTDKDGISLFRKLK